MLVYEDACDRFDIDPKKLARLAARLERVALDISAMGLTIFANSGAGTIVMPVTGQAMRSTCSEPSGLVELAYVKGNFDGGDNDMDG